MATKWGITGTQALLADRCQVADLRHRALSAAKSPIPGLPTSASALCRYSISPADGDHFCGMSAFHRHNHPHPPGTPQGHQINDRPPAPHSSRSGRTDAPGVGQPGFPAQMAGSFVSSIIRGGPVYRRLLPSPITSSVFMLRIPSSISSSRKSDDASGAHIVNTCGQDHFLRRCKHIIQQLVVLRHQHLFVPVKIIFVHQLHHGVDDIIHVPVIFRYFLACFRALAPIPDIFFVSICGSFRFLKKPENTKQDFHSVLRPLLFTISLYHVSVTYFQLPITFSYQELLLDDLLRPA